MKKIDNKNHHPKFIDNYRVPRDVSGTAVDIGCAIGAFPKTYHQQFENILCFEPVYTNFVRAIYQTRKLDSVKIFPFAFSNLNGELLNLYSTGPHLYNYVSNINDNLEHIESKHSNKLENIEDYDTTFTINLETILKLCDGHINYMKIDCEGAEMVLVGDENIQYIDYIGMELHRQIYGQPGVIKIKNWLSKYFDISGDKLLFCKNKNLKE